MALRLGQQLLVWLWTLPLIAKCFRGRTPECDRAGLNAGSDINHMEEPGARRIAASKPIFFRVGSAGVWTRTGRRIRWLAESEKRLRAKRGAEREADAVAAIKRPPVQWPHTCRCWWDEAEKM